MPLHRAPPQKAEQRNQKTCNSLKPEPLFTLYDFVSVIRRKHNKILDLLTLERGKTPRVWHFRAKSRSRLTVKKSASAKNRRALGSQLGKPRLLDPLHHSCPSRCRSHCSGSNLLHRVPAEASQCRRNIPLYRCATAALVRRSPNKISRRIVAAAHHRRASTSARGSKCSFAGRALGAEISRRRSALAPKISGQRSGVLTSKLLVLR